jgi:hypothetical protein
LTARFSTLSPVHTGEGRPLDTSIPIRHNAGWAFRLSLADWLVKEDGSSLTHSWEAHMGVLTDILIAGDDEALQVSRSISPLSSWDG